jgi:lipopolysaccharide/colanic/teichoic acid biosynthesis glycosyltransferase/cellulose synthase/poly-beta-1,6-N-acetylglucosamine synthase-like glycosyltransferase
MNSIASLISLIIASVLLVPAVYLVLLATASLLLRRREPKPAAPDDSRRVRIAVVIPAHNEEALLPAALESIARAGRERSEVEVFVIADNCSDATADLARSAGATVAERNSTADGRGKPFALRWFFSTRGEALKNFDLITLLDADTVVDANFFNEVAIGMADPSVEVAQAYYGASNVEASWRAALAEVALTVSHHLRALGRNAIGSTAGLKGNGMVFRAQRLLERGWETESLVEDLEQSIVLLESGIRVRYLPRAIVRGEMASNAQAAEAQRRRWEGGRLGLFRHYVPRLLKLLSRSDRRAAAADTLLDLVTPPLVGYTSLLAVSALGFLVFGLYGAALAMSVGCLYMVLVTVQAMLMVGAPRACWMALLKVPLFVLWKLGFYAKMAKPRPDRDDDENGNGSGGGWNRTGRDCEQTGAPTAGPRPWKGLTNSVSRMHALRRTRFWRTQLRITEPTKRILDVVASLVALFALSPLFLVTALLIWLEDRGPIFFKQVRVGHMGRHFSMWKFRSMYTDAEARKAALATQNQHAAGVTFKMKNDPRITRVGRVIRKFSIDELPQLINVLRGDMALIGPRPPVPAEVAKYRSIQLRRLRVKPGLSCLWQIAGRAEIDFAGQVKLDLEYIHSAHLLTDLIILVKTVPAVLAGRGAY